MKKNARNPIEDDDSNKLWLIVKYLTVDGKTNEFKLTGGETIKLGRVKFKVRELQTSDDENKTDYDSFENNLLDEESALQVGDAHEIRGSRELPIEGNNNGYLEFPSQQMNIQEDDELLDQSYTSQKDMMELSRTLEGN